MDEAQQMGARAIGPPRRPSWAELRSWKSTGPTSRPWLRGRGPAYTSIVALNEMGAILHYHGKRKDVRSGATLLLDAGARYNAYASTSRAPSRRPLRPALRGGAGLHGKMQQELCAMVKPGLHYGEFHHQATSRPPTSFWNTASCGTRIAMTPWPMATPSLFSARARPSPGNPGP